MILFSAGNIVPSPWGLCCGLLLTSPSSETAGMHKPGNKSADLCRGICNMITVEQHHIQTGWHTLEKNFQNWKNYKQKQLFIMVVSGTQTLGLSMKLWSSCTVLRLSLCLCYTSTGTLTGAIEFVYCTEILIRIVVHKHWDSHWSYGVCVLY